MALPFAVWKACFHKDGRLDFSVPNRVGARDRKGLIRSTRVTDVPPGGDYGGILENMPPMPKRHPHPAGT